MIQQGSKSRHWCQCPLQNHSQQPKGGTNPCLFTDVQGWTECLLTCDGIVFGHKKEWISYICNNMNPANTMLRKRPTCQTQRNNFCPILSWGRPDEAAGSRGQGGDSSCAYCIYSISVWSAGKGLKIFHRGAGCRILWIFTYFWDGSCCVTPAGLELSM